MMQTIDNTQQNFQVNSGEKIMTDSFQSQDPRKKVKFKTIYKKVQGMENSRQVSKKSK